MAERPEHIRVPSEEFAARLHEGIRRYLTALDGNQAMAVVDEFPELLSDPGVRAVEKTAVELRGTAEPDWADQMDALVKVLRRARTVGMERAFFDEMMEPFQAHVDAAEEALKGFLATGNGDLLDEAVTVWRAIVAHEYLPYNGVDYEHWALGRAAGAILYQHGRKGERALLDEAITLFERAAGLEGVRSERRISGLVALGRALLLRHDATGRRADRERAVAMLRAAESMTQRGSPAHSEIIAALSAAGARKEGRGSR